MFTLRMPNRSERYRGPVHGSAPGPFSEAWRCLGGGSRLGQASGASCVAWMGSTPHRGWERRRTPRTPRACAPRARAPRETCPSAPGRPLASPWPAVCSGRAVPTWTTEAELKLVLCLWFVVLWLLALGLRSGSSVPMPKIVVHAARLLRNGPSRHMHGCHTRDHAPAAWWQPVRRACTLTQFSFCPGFFQGFLGMIVSAA